MLKPDELQIPDPNWRRIRWLIGPLDTYPELGLFNSDEDRSVALQKAFREVGWHWRGLLAFPGLLLVSFALDRLLGLLPMPSYQLNILLCIGIGVFCHRYGSFFLMRPLIHASLRQQLAEQAKPICQECGYNMSGTPDRCPECGFSKATA